MGIEITDEQKKLLIEGKISVDEIVKMNTERLRNEVEEEKKQIDKQKAIDEMNRQMQLAKNRLSILLKTDVPMARKLLKDLKTELKKLKDNGKPRKERAKTGSTS